MDNTHDDRPRTCRGCQLLQNDAIGTEPWLWRAARQGRQGCERIGRTPRYLLDRTKGAVRRAHRRLFASVATSDPPAADRLATPSRSRSAVVAKCRLGPSDRVRVKSAEEIEQTLDVRRRLHGCPFAEPMFRYCGQEFVVAKRIERFFDEARGKLVRCNNIVILDGVFCDGSGYPQSRGCDRTCYFFWRVEWLEKVEAQP